MNRRERIFVTVGAVVVAVVVAYTLIYTPLSERRKRAAKENINLKIDIAEMREMAAEYKTLAEGRERIMQDIEARESGFSPFSYLQNLARESGLSGKIESMTPVSAPIEEGSPAMTEVDIRLGGIGVPELVRFLYRLETSDKVVFVINLNVRPRYLSPELLDVSLRLASPAAT